MPRESAAEKEARNQAIQDAVAAAAEVPLRTARLCRDGLEILDGIKERLNPNLATDVGSAASLLRTGSSSAALNVEVNLLDLADLERVAGHRATLESLRARVQSLEGQILTWVSEQIRPVPEN
jgi:glutamate formiminotransferase/formiminotetrahydrofolate cyclodeaminase